MLTCGRIAIHGAGSGGILSSSQIILSDIVTLKERGIYNGLIGLYVSQSHDASSICSLISSVFAVSGGIGPLIGGALSRHTQWRWLFCKFQRNTALRVN